MSVLRKVYLYNKVFLWLLHTRLVTSNKNIEIIKITYEVNNDLIKGVYKIKNILNKRQI